MVRSSPTIAVALFAWSVVDAHIHQIQPPSRQTWMEPKYQEGDALHIEYCPHCYNSGGPESVNQRAIDKTDPAVLSEYGGGRFPLLIALEMGEVAANGNYLERDQLAVRHGICGDPEQSEDEDSNVYSTANSKWAVLESYKQGSVLELKLVISAHQWGHLEFFICDSKDQSDPDGVPTQSCFNKHPLTRMPGGDYESPIDPNYPGRYYVDPPCRVSEIPQDEPVDGYIIHMNYHLPKDLTCERCILQMVYYTGNSCKHIGYDEFNPPSWNSECAPSKSDWINDKLDVCGGDNDIYPEEFWACSDIEIIGDDSVTVPTPEPETPTPEPVSSPTHAVITPADSAPPMIEEPISEFPMDFSNNVRAMELPKPAILYGSVTQAVEQCTGDVQPWEQCGGDTFRGSPCCRPGYACTQMGVCYSQCRPIPNGCAENWKQCDGDHHEGPTCCWPGSTCTYKDKYWSFCKPDHSRRWLAEGKFN